MSVTTDPTPAPPTGSVTTIATINMLTANFALALVRYGMETPRWLRAALEAGKISFEYQPDREGGSLMASVSGGPSRRRSIPATRDVKLIPSDLVPGEIEIRVGVCRWTTSGSLHPAKAAEPQITDVQIGRLKAVTWGLPAEPRVVVNIHIEGQEAGSPESGRAITESVRASVAAGMQAALAGESRPGGLLNPAKPDDSPDHPPETDPAADEGAKKCEEAAPETAAEIVPLLRALLNEIRAPSAGFARGGMLGSGKVGMLGFGKAGDGDREAIMPLLRATSPSRDPGLAGEAMAAHLGGVGIHLAKARYRPDHDGLTNSAAKAEAPTVRGELLALLNSVRDLGAEVDRVEEHADRVQGPQGAGDDGDGDETAKRDLGTLGLVDLARYVSGELHVARNRLRGAESRLGRSL